MDPVSTATTFATLVSLLADFVGHRGADQSKSFDELMAWLAEQRHDEIKNLLERNTDTTTSIKALLGETRQEILNRLRSLDESMAGVASGIGDYRGIAEAAHPGVSMSAQAMSILYEFNDSGASKIVLMQYADGTKSLPIVDGPNGALTVPEPRFLEDDLDTLVRLGFLAVSRNGRGDPLYSFRRSAADFVEKSRD
jgi:hypothetical protein